MAASSPSEAHSWAPQETFTWLHPSSEWRPTGAVVATGRWRPTEACSPKVTHYLSAPWVVRH